MLFNLIFKFTKDLHLYDHIFQENSLIRITQGKRAYWINLPIL